MDAATSLWHGRRVLVTGCTGFLGGAVTRELLDRGAHVVGLVRDRKGAAQYAPECAAKRFYVVDGRAEDAIRLHTTMAVHDVSAVFHLADSARGTDAVSRAACLHDKRMPVVMARPFLQLRLANRQAPPAVPLGVARFGELFGGGDRKVARVVPRTAIGLLTGERAPPTDGPARDFVHVRDAARACLAVAEVVERHAESLDLTFRSGWMLTESAMAALVADVFEGRTPEPADAVPNNPLGWQPATTLRDALAETIDWYREFGRTEVAGARRAA